MEPSLLDAILAPGGLRPLFQPIVAIAPGGIEIHSFEALLRGPQGTNMEDAEVLFEYVRRKGQETAVDRACIAVALLGAAALPRTQRVSLNVHASTLGRDHDLARHIAKEAEQNDIDPSRLIIEIVEHGPYWDGARFQRALSTIRDFGAAIALDDIGHGMSNYRMILDCRPDYFKIDRHFVKGVSRDAYRRAILESVQLLASRCDARVVAEGIDRPEDLVTLTDLGIRLLQGWLFSKARPAHEFGGVGSVNLEWGAIPAKEGDWNSKAWQPDSVRREL